MSIRVERKKIPIRETHDIDSDIGKSTRRLPLRKYITRPNPKFKSKSISKSRSYSPNQDEVHLKQAAPSSNKTSYLSSLLGSMNQFFPDIVDENIGHPNSIKRTVSEYVFSKDDDQVIECVQYVDPSAAGNARKVVTLCRTLSEKIPGTGTALVEHGPAA